MPNVVKKLVTREYTGRVSDAEGILLVSMAGLTVAETEVLRAALDEGGASLRMVKNSLARRVLSEAGFEFGDETLSGNVAMATGTTEATITAAKIFTKSPLKKDGKLELRAGVLDGSPLSAADALALADVPDKDTLRAQLVGAIQGPMRALASTLAAVPGGLARVLQARVDQGGGEQGGGEAAAD
jgi:large subunit ribosomal protein L10